jgi:hypothetical protein
LPAHRPRTPSIRDPKALVLQTSPGLNAFSVIGFVGMVQFPLVLMLAMLSPFFFHDYWTCVPELDACSRCHHTPFPIIPLSLSGVIGDDPLLQKAVFGSFALAFFVYFSVNAILVPITSVTLRQLLLSLTTLAMFYGCVYVYPLRNGCDQTLFNIATHLGFLLLTIGSAVITFNLSFSPSTKKPSKRFLASTKRSRAFFTAFTWKLCLASIGTSAVGCAPSIKVSFVGQLGFLLAEVVMCWLFTSWGVAQMQFNIDENPSMPAAHFKIVQWAEIGIYAYAVVANAHAVPAWLADPLNWSTSSNALYFCVTGLYMLFERLLFTVVLEMNSVLLLLPDRAYMLKRMYERGFTRIMIFYMLSSTLNRPNQPFLEYLYTMACIASFSALISFHAILLVDTTAHRRLGEHVGVPLAAFTVGNLIVHGLPCVMAVYFPPQALAWHHGLCTAIAQGLWGACSTGFTFKLDDIYSPAKKEQWHALWMVAQVVNCSASIWWPLLLGGGVAVA